MRPIGMRLVTVPRQGRSSMARFAYPLHRSVHGKCILYTEMIKIYRQTILHQLMMGSEDWKPKVFG